MSRAPASVRFKSWADALEETMNKRELHKAVQAEMVFAANKVASLRELERSIIKDIDYWTQQEEAARVVSIRLDMEAHQEASNTNGNRPAPEGETR